MHVIFKCMYNKLRLNDDASLLLVTGCSHRFLRLPYFLRLEMERRKYHTCLLDLPIDKYFVRYCKLQCSWMWLGLLCLAWHIHSSQQKQQSGLEAYHKLYSKWKLSKIETHAVWMFGNISIDNTPMITEMNVYILFIDQGSV